MNQESITDDQSKWELLKYEIRPFSLQYSKELAIHKITQFKSLENKFKYLEYTENVTASHESIRCKNDLEKIYAEKIMDTKIRSK